MTALTRRDALLLTAAASAASTALQPAAAADPPPAPKTTEDASILEVPSGVADGSLIPITVNIPAKDIALAAGDSLKQVTIELVVQKDAKDENNPGPTDKISIFSATLTDTALPTDPTANIAVMTRLKIAATPGAPPATGQTQAPPTQFTATLQAKIDIQYKTASETKFTAHQTLSILPQDCAPTNAALLRLALQPPNFKKNSAVVVKAVVPPVIVTKAAPPAPAPGAAAGTGGSAAGTPGPTSPSAPAQPRTLKTIACQLPSSIPFTMTVNDSSHLADEVFVSFNLYPPGDTLVTMAWTYTPDSPNSNLVASIYATMMPS
jgi:hypothetical protein